MKNHRMGIKRITAGILAMFMIVTALPEASIDALAKEAVGVSAADEKDTEAVHMQSDIDEIVQTCDEVINESETVSRDLGNSIDESLPDRLGANVTYKVVVDRKAFSQIQGFKYRVIDNKTGEPVIAKTNSYYYFEEGETQYQCDLVVPEPEDETTTYNFKITDVKTSDDSWFVFVDDIFIDADGANGNNGITIGPETKTVNLKVTQVSLEVLPVNTPTRMGTENAFDAVRMEGFTDADGEHFVKSGNTIYATPKLSTAVTLSLIQGTDYDLTWDKNSDGFIAPSISYDGKENDNGYTSVPPSSGAPLSSFKCQFEISTFLNAIRILDARGVKNKVLYITPAIRSFHTVNLSLADDSISSALNKASLSYTVYDENNNVYKEKTTLNNNTSGSPISSGQNITVPDGGYILLEDVQSGDYNVFFEKALFSDLSGTQSLRYDSYISNKKICCKIQPINGIAFHGNAKLSFANYNYKIWQGAADAVGVGEKGLLRVTNDRIYTYQATFTDGVNIQNPATNTNFSNSVVGGYYTGNDAAPVDVVFTFTSQEVIESIKWEYKDETNKSQAKTIRRDEEYTLKNGSKIKPLVSQYSSGIGGYTVIIPAEIVAAAKKGIDVNKAADPDFSDVLSVTINKKNTYIVTMNIDGVESKSSTRAAVKVDEQEGVTRQSAGADAFVVTTGTTISITASVKDEKAHNAEKSIQYGLKKVTVTNSKGNVVDTKIIYDYDTKPYVEASSYDYSYTVNDTDEDVVINIETVVLPYLSYTYQPTTSTTKTEYRAADASYVLDTPVDLTKNDPDNAEHVEYMKRYASVDYTRPVVVHYLLEGEAQEIYGDYSVTIDGTPLGSDATATLPKLKDVAEITDDPDGKTLTLYFNKIPGKDVILQIGGIKKDDNNKIVKEPRYYTFHVKAAQYKLEVNEITGTGNPIPHTSDSKSFFSVTCDGTELQYNSTDKCYYVPVKNEKNPKIIVKTYIKDEDELKFLLDDVVIGDTKDDPDDYAGTSYIAYAKTGYEYTVSRDTTINITIEDLPYLVYTYPATATTTELLEGLGTESSIDTVYTQKAIVQYFIGDTPQSLNKDFEVTLGAGTVLEGDSRTDPDVPALSEVAYFAGGDVTKLIVDFGKCATTTGVTDVKVKLGKVKSSAGLPKARYIKFKVAKIPTYEITFKIDGAAPTALSGNAFETGSAKITNITGNLEKGVFRKKSGSTNIYEVQDGTTLTVYSQVKDSNQYELGNAIITVGENKQQIANPGNPDGFEYTVNSNATIDVTTSEKTYLEYQENGGTKQVVATAEDNNIYPKDATLSMVSETSYDKEISVKYYKGSAQQLLAGDYAVLISDSPTAAGKTLSETTEPKLSEIVTEVKGSDDTVKELKLNFAAAAKKFVTVKVGGIKTNSDPRMNLTQKILYYKVGPLPDRYVTVKVESVNAASDASVADVVVKDGTTVLEPETDSAHAGQYRIPAMTEITVEATIKADKTNKYNIGNAEVTEFGSAFPCGLMPHNGNGYSPKKAVFTYKVKVDAEINVRTTPLPTLALNYPDTAETAETILAPTDGPVKKDVNYDQKAILKYLLGDTAQDVTGKYQVYIADKGADPTQLLSGSTTPTLSQVVTSTAGNSMAIDFFYCPNKTLKIVIGGEGTGLEQRAIIFDVDALASHDITFLVDGVPAPLSTHALLTIMRGENEITPGNDGKYRISERAVLDITSVVTEPVKYELDRVDIGPDLASAVPTDPPQTPDSFTYEVGKEDATINIITKGLPYIAYTVNNTPGFIKGESASSAGDVTVDYAAGILVQYMIGDEAQTFGLSDVVITMNNRTITNVADSLFPAIADIASMSADGKTLQLNFDSKKCRDHIFKIVIDKNETRPEVREISFNVPVTYTVNTGGENDVVGVDNSIYRDNIKLISGVKSGVGTASGLYDEALDESGRRKDIVFALNDSISATIDDIRRVDLRVQGKPDETLLPNSFGYYIIPGDTLEEFITYNRTITIILTAEPAVYETSLKLNKGKDYAPVYYNTDNSVYEAAYPVWSKITSARKLQKVELENAEGAIVASYDGISIGGTWAGAVSYETDVYRGISVLINPGVSYTSGDITYYMPAGKYTIVAYAREPFAREVTARFTVTIGQAITGLKADSSTQYIYKKPGKKATFKVSAIYSGGNTRTGGIFSDNATPTTQKVNWYAGDASGKPLSAGDKFFGLISFKNGTATLNKNAPDNGVFYIWAVAADYSKNNVKAGRKITVSTNKLSFNEVSMRFTGTKIQDGSAYEAYQIFGQTMVINDATRAFDRIVLKNGTEDVTRSFTIKISGAASDYDRDGIVFNSPGQVTVTATSNDGSKNRIVRRFHIVYGTGQMAYTISNENFGLTDSLYRDPKTGITEVTPANTRAISVENPYPASAGLHLSVYGKYSGEHTLIANRISVTYGKVISRSDNIRSTEYVIQPTGDVTTVTISEGNTDYTLEIQNKGTSVQNAYKVTAFNLNPLKNSDNRGRIYNYINYRQTEEAVYYQPIFATYAEKKCNEVTYSFKGARGDENVILIETTSPYMSEIFEFNRFKMVSKSPDGPWLYAAYLYRGQLKIDYTMDDEGYLNIPRGKYKLQFTPGYASSDGGGIDISTFQAYCKPIKYTVVAKPAPSARVTPTNRIWFNRVGQYGIIKGGKATNVIKGTFTYDMSYLNMKKTYPLKGVNTKGIINTFASDYDVREISYQNALVFTGISSRWLLDSDEKITRKKAKKNNLLKGYIPYAYQKADGTVSFNYTLVRVEATNGLRPIE